MVDNPIITNEGSVLERINDYQKILSELSVAPFQDNMLEDGSSIFNYKKSIAALKNWSSDLMFTLSENETQKIKSYQQTIASVLDLPISKTEYIHTFDGTKPILSQDNKAMDLINNFIFQFESYLKQLTNKYFSHKKTKERLIR